MINGKYVLEKAKREDLGQIAILFSKCFGVAGTEKFFQWKYFENPAGEAFCLLVKHKSNIVGSYVMIPEDFSVFGKPKKIYKGCDLMVLPEHRSWGMASSLISGLTERLSDSGPLFLHVISLKATAALLLRHNWKKIDSICRYFKASILMNIKFISKNTESLYRDGVLREISSVKELMSIRSFKDNASRIRIIKSQEYLQWRLSDTRYSYRITGYFKNGCLRGSIICNTGIGEADYLIDLDLADSDKEAATILLDAAYYQSSQSGRKLIIAITNLSSTLNSHLISNGYLRNPFQFGPLPDEIGLYALIDNAHGSQCLNKNNWDIYPDSYDGI